VSNRVLMVVSALLVVGCAKKAQMDDHAAHMTPADRMAPSTASSDQPGTPGIPASNATAAARLAASPRHKEWVKVAWEPGSSDSLMAYIVYPVTNRKAPVIVVIHEIFGLSTWVRGVADQLAADGFIAIAPDLISRVRGGPSTEELPGAEASRLIREVSNAERNKGISAAANYAMMQPSAEQRYGIVGYCWGGSTTFGYAVSGGVKGFSGGVAYYGAFPYTTGGQAATATTAAVPASINGDSLARIRVPLMLLNGSKDMRIAAQMPALDSAMKANKKSYAGTNYEGAIHGFLRAQDDPRALRQNETDSTIVTKERADNLAAAKDAWPKTIAFFRKSLGAR
jgi:carboxymethylenebutenolidase